MPPSKTFEYGKTYEDGPCLNLHSESALGATVITAVVTDPKAFRSDRDLAAWVVLVPRQNSTGGKQKLGAGPNRVNDILGVILCSELVPF